MENSMALRDMSEKKLIIITIVVAVVLAIPCWGYFYVVHANYVEANEKWQVAKDDGDDLQKKLDKETKLAEDLPQKREVYNQQARMLPEADEVANFFRNDLPNLLNKNAFEIQTLSMQPQPTAEKLPKGVDLKVSYRTIEIRITGNYQNMIKLLKEIEEGREPADTEAPDSGTFRLFRVASFDFTPAGAKTLEPSMKHQARIILHAFFIE